MKQMPQEENVQIFGSMLTYLQAAVKMEPDLAVVCEEAYWRIVRTHPQREFRQMAFNLLIEKAVTPTSVAALYDVWHKQQPYPGIYLSENQYMTLAYELAVRLPEQAGTIIRQQLLRLTNPDKIREFSFITPAVSPQKDLRDSLFHSFLKAENRRIEPWLVRALRYLNHPLRQTDALDYIKPALEILPEIQRTGDIFLPANWCAALLDGHNSLAAAERLSDFLEAHRDMPALLKNKVLQNGDWLLKSLDKSF
jgi:aminopeptidase N